MRHRSIVSREPRKVIVVLRELCFRLKATFLLRSQPILNTIDMRLASTCSRDPLRHLWVLIRRGVQYRLFLHQEFLLNHFQFHL